MLYVLFQSDEVADDSDEEIVGVAAGEVEEG
jgi:hypothetical protein